MRQVYVTGFGPFEGVPENPSSFIVSQLANVIIFDHELEVSVDAVNAAVIKYFRILKEDESARPIIIHFGVATGSKTIKLEVLARNKANFRLSDIRGVVLRDNQIVNDAPAVLMTTVDVDHLLTQVDSNLVHSSEDAGEYICNYLYYKSLFKLGSFADVLFIHLPLFEEIREDVQLESINHIVTLLRGS